MNVSQADTNLSILRHKIISKGMRFFATPEPRGRRITAGFSFIQRIGKSASIDVWFPDELRDFLEAKRAGGLKLTDADFPAEWAAVRQFELLQEAGNVKIYDLKSDHLWRTMLDLSTSMRAGGYRLTIVTLGSYVQEEMSDDLQILDQRLQERLSELIHTLYLENESARINEKHGGSLASQNWDFRTALPHVAVTLGARLIFKPIKHKAQLSMVEQKHKHAQMFFDILSQLPHKHIVHDTAVCLQLPNAQADNEALYCALGEDTLHGFSQAMRDVFRSFDRFSCGGLNGHEGAGSEIISTAQHMRGYGDRLNIGADQHYSALAQYAIN